jgi:hypothetical protein
MMPKKCTKFASPFPEPFVGTEGHKKFPSSILKKHLKQIVKYIFLSWARFTASQILLVLNNECILEKRSAKTNIITWKMSRFTLVDYQSWLFIGLLNWEAMTTNKYQKVTWFLPVHIQPGQTCLLFEGTLISYLVVAWHWSLIHIANLHF